MLARPFCTAQFLLFAFLSIVAFAGVNAKENHEEIIRKWQAIYGPVPFDDPALFNAMCYLNPQRDGDFTKFTSEVLSKSIQIEHNKWIKTIFLDGLRDALVDANPSAYYVNGGRNAPSLLEFKLKAGDDLVSVIENFNVIFITLKSPEGGDMPLEHLTTFLFKNVALGDKSPDEVKEKFALPERLAVGTLFKNTSETTVASIRGWKDMVFGFAGKDGISLFLFKAQRGRAEAGFSPNFNWLNRGLHAKDGETLIDPPKEVQRKDEKK